MKQNRLAKLDWWLKHVDCNLTEDFYGSDNKRYFELTLSPLNVGNELKFTFLLDKDLAMSGDFDEVYLGVRERKDSCHYGDKKKLIDVGDVTFESIINFAVAILKVLEPKLLNEKNLKELLDLEGEDD